jgi:plastocyanin
MLRASRRALPLALVLTVVLAGSALAATTNVAIANFSFTPSAAKIKLGDTVHWTNTAPTTSHTTTSDTTNPDGSPGVHWWDSGVLSSNQTFDWLYTAAGSFTYHCSIHPTLMKGTVSVPVKVKPPSGTAGTKFTITIATVPAPTGFSYTVQMKAPGGQFVDFKVGVTTTKVSFNSTGMPPGAYAFRSRLNTTNTPAGASLFSPAKSVMVT